MRHPASIRYSKVRKSRWKRKENEPRISALNNFLGRMRLRTQEETAKILGITRQRVHQLERHAIWKIRQRLEGIL